MNKHEACEQCNDAHEYLITIINYKGERKQEMKSCQVCCEHVDYDHGICGIVEAPEVVQYRYEHREGKPIPKQHLSRIKTIEERIKQYKGFRGTSKEVMEYIQTQLTAHTGPVK